MAPFGASRAGFMSVVRDDIPDSATWQSEELSQEFWENHSTFYLSDEPGDSDFVFGRDEEDAEQGLDNVLADRPNWTLEEENIDVTETVVASGQDDYQWSFRTDSDRYLNEIDNIGESFNANETPITELSSFGASGSDTLEVFIDYSDGGSGSFGAVIAITEEGATEKIDFRRVTGSGSEKFTFDISAVDSNIDILTMQNSNTGDEDNPEIEFADVIFD